MGRRQADELREHTIGCQGEELKQLRSYAENKARLACQISVRLDPLRYALGLKEEATQLAFMP